MSHTHASYRFTAKHLFLCFTLDPKSTDYRKSVSHQLWWYTYACRLALTAYRKGIQAGFLSIGILELSERTLTGSHHVRLFFKLTI